MHLSLDFEAELEVVLARDHEGVALRLKSLVQFLLLELVLAYLFVQDVLPRVLAEHFIRTCLPDFVDCGGLQLKQVAVQSLLELD